MQTLDLSVNPISRPVAEKQRIGSIDTLRGFAILGILTMNIQSFAMPRMAYWNPSAYGDLNGANYWIWLLCHALADEKFLAVFSMLFGAGIVLMTSRIESSARPSAALHYRRMMWLILIGLIHAWFIWSGNILVHYGLCGLLVYPCRKFRPRSLIALALLLVSVGSVLFIASGTLYPLNVAVTRVSTDIAHPMSSDAETAAYQGSWTAQMKARVPNSIENETLW